MSARFTERCGCPNCGCMWYVPVGDCVAVCPACRFVVRPVPEGGYNQSFLPPGEPGPVTVRIRISARNRAAFVHLKPE